MKRGRWAANPARSGAHMPKNHRPPAARKLQTRRFQQTERARRERMPHQEQYFLRQNVQVEPLVDQWYAWPHLIAPATTARNIVHRHFKIMDSYINSPQIHANAVKNPKMLGGPFIDYDGKRVDEIRELREATRCKRAALIELSEAIDSLDSMLRSLAKGY